MLDTSLLAPVRLILAPMHALVLNVTTGYVFRERRLGRLAEGEVDQRESQAHRLTLAPISFALMETDEIPTINIC